MKIQTNEISPVPASSSNSSCMDSLGLDLGDFLAISSLTQCSTLSTASDHSVPLSKSGKPRKFSCSYCPSLFTQRGSLYKHTLIHMNVRPHTCKQPGCRSAFTQKNNLLRHQAVHTRAKPFACKYSLLTGCNKRFARKENLNSHHKIHERK